MLIRRLVARNHGRPLRSVWCPAGTVAKAGTSFECRFESASGAGGTITEHVMSGKGRLAVGLDDVQVTAPSLGLAPGTPVRFRNVPGLRPPVALVLVAGRPVDPGWGEGGPGYASVPAGQVWPSPGAVGSVTVRFVNVPVTIINVGHAPLQMRLAGTATDQQGREAGEVNREDPAWPGPYGRGPDWTSRLSPPIQPGARATRYITFPIARRSQAIVFSVWPMLVSPSGATSSMSPESASFRAR